MHKDLNLFASSKNIEWLTVALNENQRITESFLEYISCNLPELKYLDLRGDGCDFFILKFNFTCNFPKLEVLHISEQSEITGSGLENFPNLRELYCTRCEKIEDENVISLLKCATNLQMLDLRLCKKITNRIVDTAIEVTRKRTNNILLEISTAGTKIKVVEIKEKLPLLIL